ncbi:MAG: ribosome small subunit-dependent GTPase A [Gammaproteobacteria bacterium]|nr:ribosome small subunit-dependent GTPase A [Gammaproteobacteria bacterium]MYC24588.1 ribosome small subunit-dependent GTPase A [Gammaproteobacteria bacterium]
MSLDTLGWSSRFSQHVKSNDEALERIPVRVIAQHRQKLVVHDGAREFELPALGKWFREKQSTQPTVGDWLLLSPQDVSRTRVLPRESEIQRLVKARRAAQVIAANVDLLLVIIACNDDFSESKLERYLALAEAAGVHAHVVLSKRDLYPNYTQIVERAKPLLFDIDCTAVNCLDVTTIGTIRDLFATRLTGLVVGSSGVGKSTLTNSLVGESVQKTQQTRSKDEKGRHTTSARKLVQIPTGGLIIDVPGIRELALTGVADSLPRTFPDIETLARECEYRDCAHEREPNCRVRTAVQEGVLEVRRLTNYTRIKTQLSPSLLHAPKEIEL